MLLPGNPGCGSAWLERLVRDQEVAGSNPVTPTKSHEPQGVTFLAALPFLRQAGIDTRNFPLNLMGERLALPSARGCAPALILDSRLVKGEAVFSFGR